jgi:hypothetical protein
MSFPQRKSVVAGCAGWRVTGKTTAFDGTERRKLRSSSSRQSEADHNASG